MKHKIMCLSLILLAGCAAAVQRDTAFVQRDKALEGMPPTAVVQKISVTAERFKFTPNEIKIRHGAHAVLEIESLDVTHGFQIDYYGINVIIPAKEKVTAEFYAHTAGTYSFRCSHYCGSGHFGMIGTIIIE